MKLLTKDKALKMAYELLEEKTYQVSEDYKMEKPLRGYEGEFAESMAAMKELEKMMEGGHAA